LPQLPVPVLVAYAGGPITIPELVALVMVLGGEDADDAETVSEGVALPLAQASFSRTEN